jgi:hypothetical protein
MTVTLLKFNIKLSRVFSLITNFDRKFYLFIFSKKERFLLPNLLQKKRESVLKTQNLLRNREIHDSFMSNLKVGLSFRQKFEVYCHSLISRGRLV